MKELVHHMGCWRKPVLCQSLKMKTGVEYRCQVVDGGNFCVLYCWLVNKERQALNNSLYGKHWISWCVGISTDFWWETILGRPCKFWMSLFNNNYKKIFFTSLLKVTFGHQFGPLFLPHFGRHFWTSLMDVTCWRHFWTSLLDLTFGHHFWTSFLGVTYRHHF